MEHMRSMKGTLENSQRSEGYSGFLHIICRNCGFEHAFFTNTGLTFYCCKCGSRMELQGLKIAWVNCECGRSTRYHTNSCKSLMDIPCISCGTPTAVEYDSRKGIYRTIRE